jgi:hypothetical protein
MGKANAVMRPYEGKRCGNNSVCNLYSQPEDKLPSSDRRAPGHRDGVRIELCARLARIAKYTTHRRIKGLSSSPVARYQSMRGTPGEEANAVQASA